MKKTILTFLLLFTILFSSTSIYAKTQKVKGYTKKNGTRVKEYYRTAPNKIKQDNFSTKGNVNPYTGKKGTKKIK